VPEQGIRYGGEKKGVAIKERESVVRLKNGR